MVSGFRRRLLMARARKKYTPEEITNIVKFEFLVDNSQLSVLLIDPSFFSRVEEIFLLNNNGELEDITNDVKDNEGYYVFPKLSNASKQYYTLYYTPASTTLAQFGTPSSNSESNASGLYSVDLNNANITTIDTGWTGASASRGFWRYHHLRNFTFNTSASSLSIGNGAFEESSIQSINLSKVTSIGYAAFRSCNNISSVTIPATITSLAEVAFHDCNNLSTITLNEASTTLTLGNYAFGWGGEDTMKNRTLNWYRKTLSLSGTMSTTVSNLTTLTVGGSVTSIPNLMFQGITTLTTLKINSSVVSVGKSAFNGCTNLASITAHSGITYIGDQAFTATSWWKGTSNGYRTLNNWLLGYYGTITSSTATYTIPSSITRIAEYAFKGQTGIKEGGIAPSASLNIVYVGESAFEGCTGFDARLLISRLNISEIPTKAFANTATWSLDNIHPNCTTIGASAFEGCSKLVEIYFPGGLTTIKEKAFSGCVRVNTINALCTSVPSLGSNVFGNDSSTWTGCSSSQSSNTFMCYSPLTAQDFSGMGWDTLFNPSKCRFVYNSASTTTTTTTTKTP